MRYLVTGTAGFIGYHLAARLLDDGHQVVGVDGFTAYYDVALKERRHRQLEVRNGYRGHRAMLEDMAALERIWAEEEIDVVVHLAAQAGVRYSLENPRSYVDTNVTGTFNLLELVRQRPVRHLMLASTSSVYGGNDTMPFRESDRTAFPLTIYAATKMSTELIAHCYSHLWGQATTAFRFFTVYGPWGRPDMALFKFTKGILEGTPIDVYNNGQMSRDFTYIDDLVEAICRLSLVPAPILSQDEARTAAASDPSLSPVAPFRVVNIGGGQPQPLLTFIEEIERAVGRPSIRNYLPMQAGDVPATFADATVLERLIGYRPSTPIRTGIERFVAWYREYHGV
jgi:UDP-glucuronate 4-epimerase